MDKKKVDKVGTVLVTCLLVVIVLGVGFIVGAIFEYNQRDIFIESYGEPAQIEITNPSFEDKYNPQDGGFVANGWKAVHNTRDCGSCMLTDGGTEGTYRKPEYKEILSKSYPYRVVDGEKAQVAFAFYGVMSTAFVQTVDIGEIYNPDGDDRGHLIQSEIWAQAWSSNKDDDPQFSPGEMYVRVGIDPTGTTDWILSDKIMWGPLQYVGSEYRLYKSPKMWVESDTVTLFFSVTNKWALKHNDVYFDKAALYALPYGSDTVPLPTQTPYPTATNRPTQTPYPTHTPAPACTPSVPDDTLKCDWTNDSQGVFYLHCTHADNEWYRDPDTGENFCAN